MGQWEKLTSHLPAGEHKQLVEILVEKAFRVSKSQQPLWTDFYEPGLIMLASPVLKQVPQVEVVTRGGYMEAERSRFIMLPEWWGETEVEAQLGCLQISSSKRAAALAHRDYLGALLGLGIKREKLGDLLVKGDDCQVIIDIDLVDYVRFNLEKVGNQSVKVVEIAQIDQPISDGREKSATVASLRLDAVLASGFNISREKATQLIKGEKVKLNWLVNTNTSAQLKKGDLISCRGQGRLNISEVTGETKKGRIKLQLIIFS